jgi:hypothetical protein
MMDERAHIQKQYDVELQEKKEIEGQVAEVMKYKTKAK